MTRRVEVAGEIKDRKGVNMPDTLLPMSAMTPKDRSDLDAALDAGMDWIALTFVQRPEDVAELKKIIAGRAGVLAKIEKPKALASLHGILELADALMVARGDLGVEMPLERVPGLQKQITRAAQGRQAGGGGDPDAGIHDQLAHAHPRRSLGRGHRRVRRRRRGDAVGGIGSRHLSGGSGADHGPHRQSVEAIRALSHHHRSPARHAGKDRADAIGGGACRSPRPSRRAPSCAGPSPASPPCARRASGRQAPIIAPTPSIETARRLSLVWGIHCVITEDARDFDDMVKRASQIACQEGFAQAGERIVITAGVPLGTPGATNMLRIAYVGLGDGGGLNIPALDLFLQCLHQVGDALQARIDRERAPIDFQRLFVVADVLHDQAETGQRAEMARLAAQHLANVGERAAVVFFHVIDGGASVPSFHVFRFDLDDGVEQLDREIEYPAARSRPARATSAEWWCRCARRSTAPKYVPRSPWR